MAFKLRVELFGHDEDVRALCVFGDSLVTASRDKTAKIWSPQPDNSFSCTCTLVGHTDYVTAATYLPPGASAQFPEGALVTGSRDTHVICWNLVTATPVQVLEGHSYQVTDVAVAANGVIVSSSLDKTLRMWVAGECSGVLSGHEGPVLCAVALPDGRVVSGSGDTTVRVWEDGKCTQTIKAHGDTVRGLAVIPGIGVVTVSHDQTGRIWTMSGDYLAELAGHTAIIYAAAAQADAGLVATASEDNTVKLWQLDGTCVQTIEHPGCIWDVAFLPNGDLVTACSDGVARVWTADANRAASQEAQQAFEAAIATKKAAATFSGGGGGGGLPAGLTLEEATALLTPGTRDGQTKVIREAGGAVAYSWSAARHEWEKIGDVIGGEGDTMTPSSKVYNGQVYDYVFDVDVEEGSPPLKLALNRTDNPYVVAEQFLLRENLPATYREQIVQFILTNTGGDVGGGSVPVNVDPFTGGGAYVPRSFGGASSAPPPVSVDPFTGSGAYVPRSFGGTSSAPAAQGGAGSTFSMTGGGVDPFTGATARAGPAARHVPQRSFMVFDNVPPSDAVARKLQEMSDSVAGQPSAAQLALTPTDATTLNALIARAASASGASSAMTGDEVSLLSRMLRWPAACLFPVLDITRLLALRPKAADALVQLTTDASGGIPLAVSNASPASTLPSTTLTALRLLVNCFNHAGLRAWTQHQRADILDSLSWTVGSGNKNVRQSMATLLLNFSVMYSQQGSEADMEGKMQVLSALVESVPSAPPEEVDTVYRSVVAVGTLIHSDQEVKSIASDLGLRDVLSALQSNAAVAGKAREAIAEVLPLL